MLYIETNSSQASYNFAVEYYLMYESGINQKVFMLWRTNPTIMVGRFQNIRAEINTKYVKDNNICVTRRKSGGGTIYTDLGGWQYTYYLPGKNDTEASFKENARDIVLGLQKLGVPAEFNDRNDILADGKKISGTARYISKSGVIHHGSLLYDTNIEEMVSSITVDDQKLISKGIKSISKRVANISKYIDKNLTPEEFKSALLLEVLGKNAQIYHLSETEKARILEIQAEIFENWDWVWGTNPAFTLSKSRRFPGGKIEVLYNSKNGIIDELSFSGDFFFDGEIEVLQQNLKGCPLINSEVLARLKDSQQFLMITSEEVASLILE